MVLLQAASSILAPRRKPSQRTGSPRIKNTNNGQAAPRAIARADIKRAPRGAENRIGIRLVWRSFQAAIRRSASSST
jgi:hypothetical protein